MSLKQFKAENPSCVNLLYQTHTLFFSIVIIIFVRKKEWIIVVFYFFAEHKLSIQKRTLNIEPMSFVSWRGSSDSSFLIFSKTIFQACPPADQLSVWWLAMAQWAKPVCSFHTQQTASQENTYPQCKHFKPLDISVWIC